MWFCYTQNNSGGSFIFYKSGGITHHVLIEADDAEAANERALHIGLYWDGADKDVDRDCPCCGDRWHRARDDEATKEPLIYDEDARNYDGYAWMKKGKEIVLHHANGKIEWFGVVTDK